MTAATQPIRLHERLEVDGQADSIREALDFELPPVRTRTLEYATHLRSLQTCFSLVLASDIRANPYFLAAGAGQLRRLRTALTATMLEHAEYLGDARLAQSANGWTLLMATWMVLAQTLLCLDRIRPPSEAAEAASDDDDDESVPLSGDLDESLDRNELRTTARGSADVPAMSMAEMRLALDVFRDRLTCLDGVDGALTRYLLRLELRAAEFACGGADAGDYDVTDWARGSLVVTAGFVATMAWYFVALKRALHTYLRMSAPSYYATTLSPGRVVPAAAATDRRAVAAFLDRYVRSLSTDDHEQAFAKIVQPYTVGAGDLEAHSYVYGMCGLEPATVRDVISRRYTADAVSYSATRKYRRSISDWWTAGERRADLTRGRHVGGGAACEAPFEQLAVLYIVNTLFVSKQHIPWGSWFLVTSRATGIEYEAHVRRGILVGMPFIVQRLGRYACIVPAIPVTGARRAQIEAAAIGLPADDDGVDDDACALYETNSALDAVCVWARFMADGWLGRVHHSTGVRLGPLLAALLAGVAAPD